jgi:hypothetical protein
VADSDHDAESGQAEDLPPLALADDDPPAAIAVQELRSIDSPERTVVAEFHRLWSGREPVRPSRKELETARALLREHGPAELRALVALAVKRMKTSWPAAKTFGSVAAYLPEAFGELVRQRRRQECEAEALEKRQRELAEADHLDEERARFEAAWRPVWETLDPEQRAAIRRLVVEGSPYLHRAPRLLEALCLDELARRRAGAPA